MSFFKLSIIVGAMLLSSIEARAWSDNNGENQTKKEDDFNQKTADMFSQQDDRNNLKKPLIIKDDKLVQKDHFSSDTPLVLPTPSQTQQGSGMNAISSNPAKILVFEDKLEVAKPKETPPIIKRSDFYVGGKIQLESVTFDSNVAADLKAHHNYVEKTYPLSFGVEAAMHRFQKYIYWNVGAFGQIDVSYKLSDKNTLDESSSFGAFGHIGLSELIHVDQFRIIPTIGTEFNVSGLFKAVDLSVGASLYCVYQNVYVRTGVYKGFLPETFTLKNNDTDAKDSMKVTKSYWVLSVGYWQ